MAVSHWVIVVANHGAFVFKGSEAKAEEMRKHKAQWEQCIALKRPADSDEVTSGVASQCWNHSMFPHRKKKIRYECVCCK